MNLIIDVHAHVTPQHFQRAVLSGSDWFGLTPADGELGNVRNRWGPAQRLEAMDEARVDVITLPLLRPTILLVVVVSIILMSKVFTNVLIISGGGPDGATRVLSLLIYQTGFQFFKMGLASAASIFLLLGTMVFTLIQLRLFREESRG